MAQKVKEKKSELQCYINGPGKLSVSKTYLIEVFIIPQSCNLGFHTIIGLVVNHRLGVKYL